VSKQLLDHSVDHRVWCWNKASHSLKSQCAMLFGMTSIHQDEGLGGSGGAVRGNHDKQCFFPRKNARSREPRKVAALHAAPGRRDKLRISAVRLNAG
jgi:hypothetical protein